MIKKILLGLTLFSFHAMAQIPTNGLVAYYPFTGNANDQSGNGNNGTVYGATLTADRFGNPNCAYSYNGSSSYIYVGNATGINNPSFSYSFWVYLPTLPSYGQSFNVFEFGTIVGYSAGQSFAVNNDYATGSTGWRTSSVNTDATNLGFQNGTLPSINTWYNVVVTRSSTTLDCYINGSLLLTTPTGSEVANYNDPLNMYFGTRAALFNYFNGVIDDFAIYNRALSQSEITSIYNGATITTQPITSQTLCVGQAASFSVVASGSGLTYQWYKGGVALTDGGTISGSTTSTLNISAIAMGDAGSYTCGITASGNGTTITTTASVLNVNSNTAITTQPLLGQILCVGQTASFNVVATGSALTYQWYDGGEALSNGGTITGCMTPTLNISSATLANSGNYTCTVNGACGVSVSSSISKLTVDTTTVITTEPIASQTLSTGQVASFSIVAQGSTLTYQWFYNGGTLSDGGNITGSMTPTLKISSLALSDAGNYSCTVSGACGVLTSRTSMLTVNTAVTAILGGTSANTIGVFPNPTNDQLTISLAQPMQNATLRVVSLTGLVIQEQNSVSGSSYIVNVANLTNGIYLLELNQDGVISRARFIKE